MRNAFGKCTSLAYSNVKAIENVYIGYVIVKVYDRPYYVAIQIAVVPLQLAFLFLSAQHT